MCRRWAQPTDSAATAWSLSASMQHSTPCAYIMPAQSDAAPMLVCRGQQVQKDLEVIALDQREQLSQQQKQLATITSSRDEWKLRAVAAEAKFQAVGMGPVPNMSPTAEQLIINSTQRLRCVHNSYWLACSICSRLWLLLGVARSIRAAAHITVSSLLLCVSLCHA